MFKRLMRVIHKKSTKEDSSDLVFWDVGENTKFSTSQIRQQKKECRVVIGCNSMITASIFFECESASIEIGSNTFIGTSSLRCSKKITVGNDVLISWGVTIIDHNSHAIQFSKRMNDVSGWMSGKKDWSHVISKEILICDKSWIGFNSILLKGVIVGEGAIIGAGSVVTNNVPSWTIVGGNPARIIREIPEDER